MVRSDRTYRFDVDPDELWSTLARVSEYRTWWPWLRSFDAHGLETGDLWSCEVQPPLPYRLRFTITLAAVDRPRRIDAVVAGDIEGEATISVEGDAGSSVLRHRSDLRPRHRMLRMVSVASPWVARWGHDWVLDVGHRQFRRRALPRA